MYRVTPFFKKNNDCIYQIYCSIFDDLIIPTIYLDFIVSICMIY